MVSCAPRLPPAVFGSSVRCGRACWARVSAVPSPSWLGCQGVLFALFFLLGVPVPGLVVPVPPSPFFWAEVLALFFFFRGVCLHVSVFLFPVGCCSWLGVAGLGWVVPPCLFGGPVFGAFWGEGGLAASGGVGGRFGGCGLFSRPPPSPPFFLGGGGCLFLPLPSLVGARTGPHSVLSSGLLLAVAFCLAVFRPHGSGGLCTRRARRPFLPG